MLLDAERLYYIATQRVLATVGVSLIKEQYIEFLLVQGKQRLYLNHVSRKKLWNFPIIRNFASV